MVYKFKGKRETKKNNVRETKNREKKEQAEKREKIKRRRGEVATGKKASWALTHANN
jgi:hypothetical protein